MSDIQPRVRDKLDVMVQRVTLTWLRGAAMVGTILLPILVLVGAGVMGSAYDGSMGGDSLAPGLFLVTVVAIGVFSGVLVAILTAGIHVLSNARSPLDYVELGLSVVSITTGFVWWFNLGKLFWLIIITIGSVGLLYIVIIARFMYYAHVSF